MFKLGLMLSASLRIDSAGGMRGILVLLTVNALMFFLIFRNDAKHYELPTKFLMFSEKFHVRSIFWENISR
jgi:hypothetical protein